MLRLRPYKPCDAKAVVGWLQEENTFHLWSAGKITDFPLTASALNAYLDTNRDDPRLWAMTAVDEDGSAVGFLTMRYPTSSDDELRFGHIVVSNEKRGRGYGRKMLSMAADFAFSFLRVTCISLAVFEQNTPAAHCYRSVGFRSDPQNEAEIYLCKGESWVARRMVLKKSES